MSRVTARCLLLIARDGDRWYRSGVERRAEHNARLEIRELDGPHHLHLEPAHFQAVATEIRDFLGL